jgi:predicted lactoylglutathione lyase
MAKVLKKLWLVGIGAFILGALVILIIRFATYKAPHVHYHANFAVFINGQQELFKDNFYYEETGAACTAEANMTPHDRAHMHDHEAGLVHVHDHTVTWNQFFNNIGWDVNPRYLNTPTQLYIADANHTVTFILNGQVVPNIANQVIGDRDKLLVDYGDESQTQLQQEEKAIPNTAAKEDTTQDPASCAGTTPTTFHDRITHLF